MVRACINATNVPITVKMRLGTGSGPNTALEITQRLDLDTPARHHQFGSHHPISLVIRRIEKIFSNFGFETHEGPEIETEYYNFESLNIADNHPARDMHDTFYFDSNLLLRTHTSSVQIHACLLYTSPSPRD